MAVPKRKHSNSRTGKRRAHDAKTARQTQLCPTCSQTVLSHAVCSNCGSYQGRQVIERSNS